MQASDADSGLWGPQHTAWMHQRQSGPVPVIPLHRALSSNDWDTEVANVFQHTTAALRQLAAETGGSADLAFFAQASPRLYTANSGAEGAARGEVVNPLEDLDDEFLEEDHEGNILHWNDMMTASATITLPSAKSECAGAQCMDDMFSSDQHLPLIPLRAINTSVQHSQVFPGSNRQECKSYKMQVSGMVPIRACYSPPTNRSVTAATYFQECPMLAHQQRTGDDSLSQYYLQVHNSLGDMQMMPSILVESDGAGAEGSRQSRRCTRAPKWREVYDSSEDASIASPPESNQSSHSKAVVVAPKKAGRKRLPVDHITLDSLQEQGLFDVPIQTAAQELGVGLSVLKRICRQIGLARWPFRTRQSLRGVIAKTQQYLGEDSAGGNKTEVVQALQQTLDGLQGEAGSGLSDTVRKYRQSVFKLNYKIKKNAGRPRLSRPPGLPVIPATAAARMARMSAQAPSHAQPATLNIKQEEGLGNQGRHSATEEQLPGRSAGVTRRDGENCRQRWCKVKRAWSPGEKSKSP